MVLVRVKVRRFGKDLGFIIPKKIVKNFSIKPNQEIWIEIKKST